MKRKEFKLLIMVSMVLLLFGVANADKKLEIRNEVTKAVNTTAELYTLTDHGYLEIFSDAKVYITLNPDGVTPSSTSRYISAGGFIDTGAYYYEGNKIGLDSDSGTANLVFTYYSLEGN